jgi:hypothetical protein
LWCEHAVIEPRKNDIRRVWAGSTGDAANRSAPAAASRCAIGLAGCTCNIITGLVSPSCFDVGIWVLLASSLRMVASHAICAPDLCSSSSSSSPRCHLPKPAARLHAGANKRSTSPSNNIAIRVLNHTITWAMHSTNFELFNAIVLIPSTTLRGARIDDHTAGRIYAMGAITPVPHTLKRRIQPKDTTVPSPNPKSPPEKGHSGCVAGRPAISRLSNH